MSVHLSVVRLCRLQNRFVVDIKMKDTFKNECGAQSTVCRNTILDKARITHLHCMQKPALFVPQTECEYHKVCMCVKRRLVGTN